ncbi:hypothetical protein TNCV_1904691 [Trichonephila clavipes]|nr:hypothetical protein TNCV_1904691 [Trichonephila clavipes]
MSNSEKFSIEHLNFFTAFSKLPHHVNGRPRHHASTPSVDYEDGQEEPDSLRADKIYAEIQLSNKLEKHFLEIDTIWLS